DGRALDLARDGLHRLEVARRGHRKAGLHHVHAQLRERASDLELLLEIHARAGRLLAIAQGGVEDDHSVRAAHVATSASGKGMEEVPRAIATAPVRTSSRMPKGRSTSMSPSSLSCAPVVSTMIEAGATSMTRARKASQSCRTSERRSGEARTLTKASSRATAGARVRSSTSSTSTSL